MGRKGKRKQHQRVDPDVETELTYKQLLKRQTKADWLAKQRQVDGSPGLSRHEQATKLYQLSKWSRSPTGLTRMVGNVMLRVFRSNGGFRYCVSCIAGDPTLAKLSCISGLFDTEDEAKACLAKYLYDYLRQNNIQQLEGLPLENGNLLEDRRNESQRQQS
jgi:hypothetical protein